jgi:hypothetical protein
MEMKTIIRQQANNQERQIIGELTNGKSSRPVFNSKRSRPNSKHLLLLRKTIILFELVMIENSRRGKASGICLNCIKIDG